MMIMSIYFRLVTVLMLVTGSYHEFMTLKSS